jgi:transmembrane sensor
METREQIEQAAAAWIAKRDLGPWTAVEETGLEAWLALSAGNRAAYYRLNAAWLEAGRLQALGTPGTGTAIGSQADLPDHAPRTATKTRYAIAASVLVGLIAAATWYLWPDAASYRTEVGGLEAIPLSDGSKVTLNTDTEIRVAVSATERRVELERGEAFFDVARDPTRPFVVRAGNRRVVAIGTQFSVREQGDDVRVVVSEGRVRLETSTGEAIAELTAGAIARARDDAVMVEEDRLPEIERTLTWRSGQLTFRDTPLAEAVAEFNRYNSRRIVIEDPAVAALEVGGVFRATNVDPFVSLLEEAFPIRVVDEGDRIVITSR